MKRICTFKTDCYATDAVYNIFIKIVIENWTWKLCKSMFWKDIFQNSNDYYKTQLLFFSGNLWSCRTFIFFLYILYLVSSRTYVPLILLDHIALAHPGIGFMSVCTKLHV